MSFSRAFRKEKLLKIKFSSWNLRLTTIVLYFCIIIVGFLNCEAGKERDATGCTASSRSRSGGKCHGKFYLADEGLSRAGGIPLGSNLSLLHRNEIFAWDRRCSFPASSWGHSTLHQHPIPRRLYNHLDMLGQDVEGYRPGTRWSSAKLTQNVYMARAIKRLGKGR